MTHPAAARIAIIGAGMAGMACAHALQQLGCRPVLLEKSRGVGGRLATRRTAEGEHFDHGAQYITAQQTRFQKMLQTLDRQHSAAVWSPIDPARTTAPPQRWMIGTPGMSALLKPLTSALELHTQTTVSGLHRSSKGWHLHTDSDATLEPFDAVVCTAPAAQCHTLLSDFPDLQAALAPVRMAPCWAVMLRYADALPVDFDARRFETGAIGWLARQCSRPGYAGKPHSWVLHARPEWSQAHLETRTEQVLEQLQQELATLLGTQLPQLGYAAAHRWRYALTTVALGQPYLASDHDCLYAAGDWCLGARVEYAHTSGEAVAAALAHRLQLGSRQSDD